jgi:hypothetical protein
MKKTAAEIVQQDPPIIAHIRPYAAVMLEVFGLSANLISLWDWAGCGCVESGWGYGSDFHPTGDPFGLGDTGHGFGLWQLDDRSESDRIAAVMTVLRRGDREGALRELARQNLGVALEKRAYMVSSRRPRPLEGDLLRRTIWAAYNAGQVRTYQLAIAGHDPDTVTTPGCYGALVIAYSDAIRAMAPDLFGPEVVP